jgi:ribosomal protein L39E
MSPRLQSQDKILRQNSSLPLWMSPRLQSQDKILRQNSSLPLWMSPRLQSQDKILTPEFIFTDWNLDSNLIQSEIMSSNINNNMLNTTDVIRRHSAR